MKKKLISLVLLCVIGFSSLFGCSDKTIPSINKLNINGQDIVLKIGDATYTADDLFLDMLNTNDGINNAYSKIFKLVVKDAMPVDKNMQDGIDLEFDTWNKGVEDEAKENGVKYKDVLKAKLEEIGFETVEELKESYAYKAQLKKLKTIFWKENKSQYMDEYINQRMLYYVRHILVKVSQANENQDNFYTNLESNAAEKLFKVYDMIVNGKSFSQVAYLLPSEDEGSAVNGGAYTVDIDRGFVGEFKYGMIAFDAFSRGLEDELFGIDDDLKELYQNGFDSIPASYFIKLNEVKNDSYLFYPEDLSSSYTIPRNIIFNNYFNTPGISMIEYDFGIEEGQEAPSNTCLVDFVKGSEGVKVTKRVLCDEKENPIFLTRGSHGIHFLVLEKSPFDLEDTQKFFSLDPDKEDDYTSYSELEEKIVDQNKVLDELEASAKTFAKLGLTDDVVAGEEKFLDYDMFIYYLEKENNGKTIKIVNETIKDLIYGFIENERQIKNEKILATVSNGWTSYVRKIENSKSPFAKKQIPPLECLEYNSGNQNCKYTYADGFTIVEGGE